MEQTASTSDLKTKQLLLKKSIVVKFLKKKGFENQLVSNGGDTETTTSVTIPTTTIITSAN